MTKDVLVSISGMHEEIVAVTPEVEEDENEAIEVVTPATYYLKNGKHYIVYEEVVEGTSGVIKNRIKINGDECVEIVKSGLSNSHMIFEKNKKNQTFYKTPYGQMLIGVNTRHLQVDFEEDKIAVQIDYELFRKLIFYHLGSDDQYEEDIRNGLEEKLDALVRHELYTKYKTAPSEEEQEKARQEYLDKRGVSASYRW